MTKHERYRSRYLLLQRHQLDRDLCAVEKKIREYMGDMTEKYLGRGLDEAGPN